MPQRRTVNCDVLRRLVRLSGAKTRQELADAFQVDNAVITRMMQGKYPTVSLEVAERMRAYFAGHGLDTTNLFAEDEANAKQTAS
ncbi:MAG: hypothetical protein ACM3X6_03010 [Patescibacteria group bacterium]